MALPRLRVCVLAGHDDCGARTGRPLPVTTPRATGTSGWGSGHPHAPRAEADEALRASGLDYTVVRPGGLTDDEGTGLVTIAESTGRGQIPRADVARTLFACLDEPGTIGKSFDLISGETPIAEALPR